MNEFENDNQYKNYNMSPDDSMSIPENNQINVSTNISGNLPNIINGDTAFTNVQEENIASQTKYYETTSEDLGFAITSLITGIFSLICCCFIGFNGILAIISIIFGAIYLNKGFKKGRGLAIAGIICSAVGLLLCILIVICGILGNFASTSSYFEDLYDQIL